MPRSSRLVGRRAHGGVLIVPGRVNDQDLEFLVDSGAAYSGLAKRAADVLQLMPTADQDRKIALAHGAAVSVPTVSVQSLIVGGHLATDLQMLVLDFPDGMRIDGLLGMDFLGRFRVTIEPDTATLVLRPLVARAI